MQIFNIFKKYALKLNYYERLSLYHSRYPCNRMAFGIFSFFIRRTCTYPSGFRDHFYTALPYQGKVLMPHEAFPVPPNPYSHSVARSTPEIQGPGTNIFFPGVKWMIRSAIEFPLLNLCGCYNIDRQSIKLYWLSVWHPGPVKPVKWARGGELKQIFRILQDAYLIENT
jgi:hypothetical protein